MKGKKFEVKEYSFASPFVLKRHRLVFLSDLHNEEYGPENRDLAAKIRELKPEIILVGGDIIHAKHGINDTEIAGRLIRDLTSIAPVYYGDGNHEQRMFWPNSRKIYGKSGQDFMKLKEEYPFYHLQNTHIDVGEDLCIFGLDYDRKFYYRVKGPDMKAADIEAAIGKPVPGRFNILLAHHPSFLPEYGAWGADLSISGHNHGGLVGLPFGRGLASARRRPFDRFCWGEYHYCGRHQLVCRGLGSHTIKVRLFNRPEIFCIELLPL